jgi:hypothetical protein
MKGVWTYFHHTSRASTSYSSYQLSLLTPKPDGADTALDKGGERARRKGEREGREGEERRKEKVCCLLAASALHRVFAVDVSLAFLWGELSQTS